MEGPLKISIAEGLPSLNMWNKNKIKKYLSIVIIIIIIAAFSVYDNLVVESTHPYLHLYVIVIKN